MRGGQLVLIGIGAVLLGLLLQSWLVEKILDILGFLFIAVGILALAVGLYQAIRRKA
ncbi:MAG: hypothetical protein HY683_00975 [Chloroflexi bacterium]|nr:hypothetical protein [Chloroflexota bacterium]